MNPYEPIFEEIANALLDVAEIKPNYTDNAILNVAIIFQSVFMDKLFDKQNRDNLSLKQRKLQASNAGNDLRELILRYTDLDTLELANMK